MPPVEKQPLWVDHPNLVGIVCGYDVMVPRMMFWRSVIKYLEVQRKANGQAEAELTAARDHLHQQVDELSTGLREIRDASVRIAANLEAAKPRQPGSEVARALMAQVRVEA